MNGKYIPVKDRIRSLKKTIYIIFLKYHFSYQNPQNPALQNLLYINPNDICKQPYKCNINFDKPLCVDGFDSKSNLCKVTKEGFTKGELIGTVLGIIIAVTIICFVFSLLI